MTKILLVLVRVWSFMLIDAEVSWVVVLALNWASFGTRLWVKKGGLWVLNFGLV